MPRAVRVASIHDVRPGRGRTVAVDGLELAIFNAGDGRYYATSPLCPHEDGPLGDGAVEENVVLCPWHGYDFDLRTGACLIDPDLRVTVYPVRVEGDDLVVELP